MPQQGIWNVEWLNQNAQRNYPISEEATARDITGTFQLPQDLIVDLVWPVQASAAVQTDRFYIHSVAIFGGGITVTLGYHLLSETEGVAIGSVSVPVETHTRNQSYFISGTGDFYDSIGKITIGDLTNALNISGYYKFDIAGGRLEPTVVRPNLRGVSAIVLVNGADKSDPLVGDIQLVAGTNFRLVPSPNPGGDPQIRLDAIAGAGLNQACTCDGQVPVTGQPILTINGIPPNNSGDFSLVGDECLELTGITNGIEMNDKCSQACCGCQELEVIVQEAQTLANQISTLESFITRLGAQVDATLINLISSKTSDVPCESGGGGGSTNPPPAPTAFQFTLATMGQRKFKWNWVGETGVQIIGYIVETRYTMGTFTSPWSASGTTAAMIFTETSVLYFGRKYEWRVKAYNTYGQSSPSNVLDMTT